MLSLMNWIIFINIFMKVVFCQQCNIGSWSTRLDCFPTVDASEEKCLARRCCWDPKLSIDSDMPACYYPKNYPSYKITSINKTCRGYFVDLNNAAIAERRLNEFEHVLLEIRHETRTRLRLRFTIPSDPNRWEPPIPLGKPDDQPPANTDYDTILTESPFGMKIVRKDQQHEILLDSTEYLSSSTIFSDQFLQIAFKLFVQRAYGPGELRKSTNLLNKWARYGLWARDQPPDEHTNLYGVHNMFMGLDSSGSAFGVFLLNSNAGEVVLTPLPSITYRTIGGILDFFILTGPRPKDVIQQYYELIGHPAMPPYWSLGYQLSRYGYQSLDEVKDTLKRNLDYGIPIDVQWFDIDYMDRFKVWTINQTNFSDLGEFMSNTLHEKYKIRSVLITDPGIATECGSDYLPFKSGIKLGVFIRDDRTGNPILGRVWPGETVFPDFSHPNAKKWWFEAAERFHQKVPFDGLWVDMNEPASFIDGSTTGCDSNNRWDNPPFVPRVANGKLYAKTICPSARHYDTLHYNRHNLYGYDHAVVTHQVMRQLFRGKRPFILSRSTFAGSGRYAVHWTGDNLSSWKDMATSISQLINFNIFGIPMVGADICGFREDAEEELCIRWHQLGAFYPFSRNHNAIGAIAQDPMSWSDQARLAIWDAIRTRYLLLPYLYTLMFRAHLYGRPIIRALSFEYPHDVSAHRVESQFMWGSCLLINPVLESGHVSVESYVPEGSWINLSTGKRIVSTGKWFILPAPLPVIPVLLRAGCIIPIQTSHKVTSISRKEGLGLLIGLTSPDDGSLSSGAKSKASGELYWDDGESDFLDYVHIRFSVEHRVLRVEPSSVGRFAISRLPPDERILKTISIIGIVHEPTAVYLGNNTAQYTYDQKLETLSIKCPVGTEFTSKLIAGWSF